MVVRGAIAGGVVAVLAACNIVPADGPDSPSKRDRELTRYVTIVALSARNIEQYGIAPPATRPSSVRLGLATPPALLAPGDSVNVRVFESRDKGLFAGVMYQPHLRAVLPGFAGINRDWAGPREGDSRPGRSSVG